MKHIVNNQRKTPKMMQSGLIKALLAVVLVAASLPAVSGRNHRPVISGTPPTSAVVGSSYNFQPTASDGGGNTLSFGISNKPAWASFSTTTGRLSGTPGTDSIGTYRNIVISARGRKKSASLPAFNIQVFAASTPSTTSATTGTISLRWTAPVKRSDGTPISLADIDGYYIHYGKFAGTYTTHLNVANGTATSVTLTDVPLGTYYIVMTTYDVAGRESGYSSMLTKTVQ